ncbi:hypothetical protein SLUN_00180 [Streptomyces lunaelactis]|uniref:Integral membrane protein n=1 Tax=Streptomyces lunaelactis TaxID=1535768 RepID=A0A2R4SVM9_9ACTN|nr:hypothetical protein SLUN_00180 [Streptomyces lunaelactis]
MRLGRAGIVVALTAGLVLLGSSGAYAADSDDPAGVLGPLNVKTSEGVRLEQYELTGGGDGPIDTVLRFILSGIFALSRTLVGFACWLVDWAYQFPIIDKLAGPAQRVSDAYQDQVVTPLGIAPLFLGWAFIFGLIMVMRGKVARGFGEITLTLLIAAIAATSVVRPDVLLGPEGPLQQTQRAALEVATITSNRGSAKPPGTDPCDLITGPAQAACQQNAAAQKPKEKKPDRTKECAAIVGPARDPCLSGERVLVAGDVSRPITKTLTRTLVVQPYMLLQYGRIIEADDPLYKAHQKSLSLGEQLPKDDPCREYTGTAGRFCVGNDGYSEFDLEHGKARKKVLEEAGDDGKVAAQYMNNVTWPRVLGALLVLVASVIIVAIVLTMVLSLLAAQLGCVAAAVAGCVVFAWAMLPGPNRAVLWKWVGMFAAATVVLFGTAVFLPAFGVAADELLSDSNSPMLERLLLLDGLAFAGLALHRRMLRSGGSIGQRFAERMRFARVGGSHLMGENAAATGMALASLGVGRGGDGLTAGGLPGHAVLNGRRASFAANLNALGDSTGMPGHPAGLIGDAVAEGRRGLAPVMLGLNGARHVWTGTPPDQQQPGPDGQPGTQGRGQPNGLVIDGSTGEIISDPSQGPTPVGTRLEQRLRRTRGGRVLNTAGKVAFHSTVGLPATWTRARRAKSALTGQMKSQLTHYDRTTASWLRDSHAGARDLSTPARRGYESVARPLREANRLRLWSEARPRPEGEET